MHIVVFLLFGLIVGSIARFLVPGRQRGGVLVSMVLGVIGSFFGAFLGRALGIYREGETAGLFMSLAGAIMVVAVYEVVTRQRHVRT